MDARAIEKLIYQQSGLLGVSGISSDMRTLQESDDPARQGRDRPFRLPHRPRAGLARGGARRARRDRVHRGHRRAQRVVARARVPRRRVAGRRARRRGQRAPRPAHQHAKQAASPRWVIPTNEELMIARHTRDALSRRANEREGSCNDRRHASPGAERPQGARRRHRQRPVHRVRLREGVPRARRRRRRHLPQREGEALRRAARAGARGADLPAARRVGAGAARGGVRCDRHAMGAARHPRALDRVRAEGGPAGRAPAMLGGRLRQGDGRVVPFVRAHGAARGAADDATAGRCSR